MNRPDQQAPATVVAIGAGHRTLTYCRYALDHPEELTVVAVAEPDVTRRRKFAELLSIPAAMQFESYEDLQGKPPLAQAAVNGTMDQLHYQSTMSLLEAGYNVLLEKPIAQTEQHVRDLIDTARKHQRTVMICHVLRYAPFYRKIKDLLDDGAIGSIVALTSNENVSYHHMAIAFIRGRWRKTEANPILLAKCCHDLDLIAWYMSGTPARRVASFGSLSQFRPENAPAGSAPRCLDGCQIEASCPYSAKINYMTRDLWDTYAWEPIEDIEDPTDEQRIESLRTDNPHGRCVWHCDNDVADHQTVIAEFANGVTATHNLFCATARATRTLLILGTEGEIEGDMETGVIKLRKPTLDKEPRHTQEIIDSNVTGGQQQSGHGGGDARLAQDFVSVIRGNEPSKSVTRIEESLTGHLIAFAADTAMREGRVVDL